ncbi:hypothetical protein FK531_09210 [Rhodococcus spelaei]|uniref:Secreted protein n=1 Tax=Rhodococcus spelaei TaxID=2546320 RepID=A0A541BMZ0_9NOCA|nr:hypothetical protein [Rhodococcus spelaei]TQF73638.1 hypothetical protein FK531_09210 [Rhodococcus spelaei]
MFNSKVQNRHSHSGSTKVKAFGAAATFALAPIAMLAIGTGTASADMQGRQPAVTVNPDNTVIVTCTDTGYGTPDTSFQVVVWDPNQVWGVTNQPAGVPTRRIGPLAPGQEHAWCSGDQSGNDSQTVYFSVPANSSTNPGANNPGANNPGPSNPGTSNQATTVINQILGMLGMPQSA